MWARVPSPHLGIYPTWPVRLPRTFLPYYVLPGANSMLAAWVKYWGSFSWNKSLEQNELLHQWK